MKDLVSGPVKNCAPQKAPNNSSKSVTGVKKLKKRSKVLEMCANLRENCLGILPSEFRVNQTARKEDDPNLNVMRARESKIPKDRGRASRAKTSKEIERDPSKGNPREPRETKYLH